MNYIMKRIDENTVEMVTDRKDKIIIRFTEEDNPDIEDMVTNNLLMSYEQRIGADIINNC